MRIALCVIATKRYKELLLPLLESAKKYFLPHHNVSFFIFADSSSKSAWIKLDDHEVCWTQIEHLPFPLPSLFRYKYILRRESRLSNFDYIFYCDADMRFVGEVGDEMLGDGITAIEHPSAPLGDMKQGFKDWTFEKNPKSLAYIPPEDQNKYWCGGIQGGSSKKFLDVIKTLDKNIDEDLGQNIVAPYYDETHWNKYLSQNPADIELPFWYCFPESKDGPPRQNVWRRDVYVPEEEEVKILCLDKDLHGGYDYYRGSSKK